jgi:hypothetical protein
MKKDNRDAVMTLVGLGLFFVAVKQWVIPWWAKRAVAKTPPAPTTTQGSQA